MGFLKRLLGGDEPADNSKRASQGPISDWSDADFDGVIRRAAFMDVSDHKLKVVGVGQHQGTLELIARGRTIDGAVMPDHWAALLPEPDNVYDENAVRVVLTQQGDNPLSAVVGYLSREDAVAYRPAIDRLAAAGLVLACRASIVGGWDRADGRGSFGVRLHVATPAGVRRELDVSGV